MSGETVADILLCGQIRNLLFFQETLRRIARVRTRVRYVVLVTWPEDLAQIGPEGIRELERVGVRLVTPPKPVFNPMGGGSMAYQMVQLISGLRALPPDGLVLKSRPDVRLEWQMLPGLLDAYSGNRAPEDGLAGLRQRIWVRYAHASIPLGLPDVLFLGLREDLLKVAHLDASLTLLSGGRHAGVSIEELRLWSEWFRRQFPVFDEYHDFLGRADLTGMESKVGMWMGHPRYRLWLGAYHELLRRYFLVGAPYYDGPVGIIRLFEAQPNGGAYMEFNDQAPDGVVYDNVPGTFGSSDVGFMTFGQHRWLDAALPHLAEGAAQLHPAAFRADPRAARDVAAMVKSG